MFAVRYAVVQPDAVRGVDEIAAQNFGGRAQGIVRIHVLLVFRFGQPPVIAQSRNHGVGSLDMRGRILIFKALETHADFQSQRLGQGDGRGRLEILPRAVRGRSQHRKPSPARSGCFGSTAGGSSRI